MRAGKSMCVGKQGMLWMPLSTFLCLICTWMEYYDSLCTTASSTDLVIARQIIEIKTPRVISISSLL